MSWFRRGDDAHPDAASFPKEDRGSGSLGDYAFDLLPAKRTTVLRLAGSDPHQDVLEPFVGAEDATTASGRRSAEDERTDAPLEVRLFVAGRVTPVVGVVPRGLEAVYSEAIGRLEGRGEKPRIPVTVVRTRAGLRVELQMGATR